MQPITTIFHKPADVPVATRGEAARSFYAMLEDMRFAAADPAQEWASYTTFKDYAKICFWAIRKLEYSFIAEQFAALETAAQRPLRVLDVGCGIVPLNNWMSASGHEVVALDPLFPDVQFLVQNDLNAFYGSNVHYLNTLGEGLPFPTGYFDVVFSASVLEHTTPGNDRIILNEIARVIKPSGTLLITFDVSPLHPILEGEQLLPSDMRYFGYPFHPLAVRRLFEWLSRFYKVTVGDISPVLDELTWDTVHDFWRTMQEYDGRETPLREYLALGAVLTRNERSFQIPQDEIICAYREGQTSLEQQLSFYRYHADHRLTVIQTLEKSIQKQEALLVERDAELIARDKDVELIARDKDVELIAQDKVIQEKDAALQEKEAELIAKENIIQSFRGSRRFWLLNGPFGSSPILRRFFGFSLNIRDRFAPKLGVYHQYPPRPMRLPHWYRDQPRLADADLPVISIVTPSYNQAVFLERTIQSVLSQEYPKLEYVIQDGNSTDGSADILEKYRAQLKHAESVRDGGQGNAINLGMRHVTGGIMAYLNSDDMLLPGTLHYVARYFAAHPDVDVVYGHRVIVDENDQEVGVWVMPPHDKDILQWADYVPQETMFWRRSIWEKSGGQMDESFQFALDWDLLIRFQQAGAKIVRLPRFLAAFRVHNAQKSTAQINERGLEEMNQLRERMHNRTVSLEEVHRRIRSYLWRSVWYHKLYRLGLLRY
jgi:glycosyltransferase involved in cell wall biosynthesis/SAM-dependent methyltransferase